MGQKVLLNHVHSELFPTLYFFGTSFYVKFLAEHTLAIAGMIFFVAMPCFCHCYTGTLGSSGKLGALLAGSAHFSTKTDALLSDRHLKLGSPYILEHFTVFALFTQKESWCHPAVQQKKATPLPTANACPVLCASGHNRPDSFPSAFVCRAIHEVRSVGS